MKRCRRRMFGAAHFLTSQSVTFFPPPAFPGSNPPLPPPSTFNRSLPWKRTIGAQEEAFHGLLPLGQSARDVMPLCAFPRLVNGAQTSYAPAAYRMRPFQTFNYLYCETKKHAPHCPRTLPQRVTCEDIPLNWWSLETWMPIDE